MLSSLYSTGDRISEPCSLHTRLLSNPSLQIDFEQHQRVAMDAEILDFQRDGAMDPVFQEVRRGNMNAAVD